MILEISKSLIELITKGDEKGRLCILNYHRVLDKSDPFREGDVDIETFRWHMMLLKKYFNVLPLIDAVGLLSKGELPSRAVCITFDDGYADNERNALPILSQLDISATFFISTAYLDKGCMWNDIIIESVHRSKNSNIDLSEIDLGVFPIISTEQKKQAVVSILNSLKYLNQPLRQEKANYIGGMVGGTPNNLMLSSSQVKKLHASGMGIGSHTVTHPILKNISTKDAQQEITQSKRILENMVNDQVSLFAYPNGYPGKDYTAEHARMVKDAGYVAAVTTQWGVSNCKSDFWQLPRFRPWNTNKEKYMLNLLRNYFRQV